MEKTEIRAQVRSFKRRIGAERLAEFSCVAPRLIAQCPEYAAAKSIMLYHPLWDEVDIKVAITEALNNGKRVFLPSVVGNDIVPLELTKNTEWRVGDFGIMEPVAEQYTGEIDMVIVPGVAFDSMGNRLGRGRGYYDRFLAAHQESARVGICFDFQIVQFIPVEPHDYKMHRVLIVPTRE